ncbi:MAG: PIG-L family deacetylase [Microthrixaceae bacterium]
MATVVCFHAHPDDESITTGGLIAKLSAEGHRVVLVVATRGERGKVVPGVLGDGEPLGLRRIAETMESAAILGVQRVEFLGYVDSGMAGDESNAAPYVFCGADVDSAARRLAVILDEESADLLTVYDDNGNYGHPDHIQVHRVGRRAGELARTPKVLEATTNRDELQRLFAAFRAQLSDEQLAEMDAPDGPPEVGVAEERITHCVDVTPFVGLKRRSMAAHASQIAPDDFFLSMPEDAFTAAFGREWFVDPSAPRARGDRFLDRVL